MLRKQKGAGCLELIVLFFAIAIVVGLVENMPSWFWWLLLVVLVALVLFAINAANEEAAKLPEQRQKALETVRGVVTAYMDTLARKKQTLVRKGDYGETIDDGWNKEINKFLTLRLPREAYTRLAPGGDATELEAIVDRLVSAHIRTTGLAVRDTNVANMDGVEYEVFCAEILKQGGWSVQRTPSSTDHGIDLIASKKRRRVAIQCKRYSRPVGNNAVREAHSGMNFFDAEEAAVVTNSTFTNAAKVAANKLNVSLLHHDQLKTL